MQVQYMVDMTFQRHILHLGATQHQKYAAGMSNMHFTVSAIDTHGLKSSWLNNVGLLLVNLLNADAYTLACHLYGKDWLLQVLLKDGAGEPILQISMVTQVLLPCVGQMLKSCLSVASLSTASLGLQIEMQGSIPIRHMISPLE